MTADAGIERGGVIIEANQRAVSSVAELTAAVERTGTRPALLLVNRRGATVCLSSVSIGALDVLSVDRASAAPTITWSGKASARTRQSGSACTPVKVA